MALWTVAFPRSTPVGGPIVGWIGEHAGPRWGLAIGGLAALTAGALGFRSLGRLRHEPAGAYVFDTDARSMTKR